MARKSVTAKKKAKQRPAHPHTIEVTIDTGKVAVTPEQVDRLMAYVKNQVVTWAHVDHGDPIPRISCNHEGTHAPPKDEGDES
jgi:hypothetical protein